MTEENDFLNPDGSPRRTIRVDPFPFSLSLPQPAQDRWVWRQWRQVARSLTHRQWRQRHTL